MNIIDDPTADRIRGRAPSPRPAPLMMPVLFSNRLRTRFSRPRSYCILGLFLFAWGLVGLPEVRGQEWESLRIQSMSVAAEAKGGIEMARNGRFDEALPLLEASFQADSSLHYSGYGSVAYWLGKAYARSGDSSRAPTTWRRGLQGLEKANKFDVRLADQYLQTLTRGQLRNERLQAVEVYIELLGRLTPDTSETVRGVFHRRIAQIEPLLPEEVFQRTVEGERSDPETWSLRAEGGAALQSWFQGLDPFPDTPENERLEEHVTRLVHAQRAFACSDEPSALDDRGTTYLQFGAPYKRRMLRYQDGEFFQEVFRFGVPIPPGSFPTSEMWLYPQIDESGYYLFAEDGSSDCFYVATANDLLPNTLTMQRGDSERGLNIAYSSLMAMRSIYRELALYHIDFSGRYSEIADYASRQEMAATRAEAGFGQSVNAIEIGAGIGQTRQVVSNPLLGLDFPNQFVTRMVSRAEREDTRAAKRRKEQMPRQYTALHEDTPRLPVAVRTARFLTPEGTTYTDVYWGVPSSEASLVEEDADTSAGPPSMIRFSTVQYDEQRTETHRYRQRHQLPGDPSNVGATFVPAPLRLQATSSPYHLTMQWAQHRLWQNPDGSIAGLGPKRRLALSRADSLQPLRATGPEPEMSDLRVLSLPDTTSRTLADPAKHATPYPFRRLTADTPLVLSFELYHLTFGEDDRTRYTVAYEVEGETTRGWSRLFRGQDTQRTETETTQEGTDRRTEEMILLDLTQIERDEAQDVRVTVRVTDEVTGAAVTRTVEFRLQPGDDST